MKNTMRNAPVSTEPSKRRCKRLCLPCPTTNSSSFPSSFLYLSLSLSVSLSLSRVFVCLCVCAGAGVCVSRSQSFIAAGTALPLASRIAHAVWWSQQLSAGWRRRAEQRTYSHQGSRRARQGAHEPKRLVAVWRPHSVAGRTFRSRGAREAQSSSQHCAGPAASTAKARRAKHGAWQVPDVAQR